MFFQGNLIVLLAKIFSELLIGHFNFLFENFKQVIFFSNGGCELIAVREWRYFVRTSEVETTHFSVVAITLCSLEKTVGIRGCGMIHATDI